MDILLPGHGNGHEIAVGAIENPFEKGFHVGINIEHHIRIVDLADIGRLQPVNMRIKAPLDQKLQLPFIPHHAGDEGIERLNGGNDLERFGLGRKTRGQTQPDRHNERRNRNRDLCVKVNKRSPEIIVIT